MKQRTRITAEMEQKMQELQDGGKSAGEIAAVIGVSVSTVKRHTIENADLAAKKQAREEAVRKMYAEGKTYAQIEAETGASAATILKYTQGMPRRNIRDSGCRRLEPAQRQAQIETIRRMYSEGRTYTQISAETGANSKTIRDYTRDLPRRRATGNGTPLSPERVERIRKLCAQGKSREEIAGLLGIHPSTVKKYTQDILAEQPGQPGTLCRHKKTCRYWRHMSGLDCYACHYPVDNPVNRPWPADQCPGFPGPKTGPNPAPMSIKRKR